MFGFQRTEELDDFIKEKHRQGILSKISTSYSEFELCSTLHRTRNLMNCAYRSLQQVENELLVLESTCSSQTNGSQRAYATVDCIFSYVSSKNVPTACSKLSKASIENPLGYLLKIVQLYSEEITACESTLEDLLATSPTIESYKLNQFAILQSLVGVTRHSLSMLHTRLANIARSL
jgi:hypothetical protein